MSSILDQFGDSIKEAMIQDSKVASQADGNSDANSVDPLTQPQPSTTANSLIRLASEEQKSGWIGKIFGASEEKSGNIAGVTIICSLILILICMCPALHNGNTEKILTIASSLITLSLGYLFGKKE